MGWVKSITDLLGNLFGWGREHEARVNAPEIKANKVAGADADREAAIAREEDTAAAGDLEPLRKDIAE